MVVDVILPIFTELIKHPIRHVVVSAKRHICYAFTCDSKVEKLAQETEELKNKRSRLQQSVDEATRKGEEIYDCVMKWLDNADKAIQDAQQFITGKDEVMKNSCFIGFCPNLRTRYQLSRRSEKKASAIRNEKEPAAPISYSPAPKQMTAPSVYSREALPSRVSMLKDVMDALKDPELNMIGVYGMGGVGKTTLAKEVHRQAQADKLFDVVIFVAVSQSPEIARIQKEIAEVLGLQLNEEGLLLRAYKLSERLKNEKKILIILDDVWNQLKLEEVGIPFGDDCKGCKILLTSRKRDVCCAMSAKKAFPIEVLSDEEAWSLFKMNVADGEYSKLPPIATEVSKKCSGLPLLINVVATDLRNKEPSDWEDKFGQLSVLDSEEIYIKLHKVLENSYDNLRDDELRKFFLLCGLFGQSNIQIQYLLEYSIGLGLFKHITVLKHARNRVERLIRELKAECLLIDGDMDGFVKMHDVVRDTAISIASRVEHAFVGTSGFEVWEWPKEDCTRICLPYCDIKELPGRLEYPKVEMLLLLTEDFSLQISDLFFDRMRKLKVVDLTGMHFASLPSSLGLLANIHTLCLHRCQLDDGIAIIGELKQLEVLSFADSYIVELPREIEQLGRLKLLDLSNCSKLKVIPANVLSKLTKLEELYMRNSFVQWKGINNNQKNASLGELEELCDLTTLELEVPNPVLLQKFVLSKVLRKYWIHIGEREHIGNESDKFSKALLVEVSNGSIIDLGHGMRVMLKEAEYLFLSGIENGLYNMDDGEVFLHLKHLNIYNDVVIQQIIKCPAAFPNLESLSLGSLKGLKTICDGEVAEGSFNRLTTLKVYGCGRLTNLLTIHTARCLSQLQVLEVEGCGEMEYIVVGEDNNEMVEFTQLVSLKLRYLRNLRSFWKGKKQSTAISKDASLSLFNTTKVSFPKLDHLELYEINCRNIWELDNHHQHQLSNLTTLTVNVCNNLRHLFGVSLIKMLTHLKSLKVSGCQSMEEIILTQETEFVEDEEIEEEEKERKVIVFPKLDYLLLDHLTKLMRFCNGYSIQFQSLRELRIRKCRDLISFAGGGADIEVDTKASFFNHMVAFPNLEVMSLLDMSSLKYIWHNQLGDDDSFSKLKSLRIQSCSKLLTIFPLYGLRRFRRLEKLNLQNCSSVQEIYQVQHFNDAAVESIMVAFELKDLHINVLSSLKHIWSKNLQEVFTFEKLQSLCASYCEDLEYIFPSSIARHLSRLEKLKIAECGVLEIVAEAQCTEQLNHPFKFPQLFSVKFSNLKKLTSFYPRMPVKLPNLKCAKVYGCHKVIKFASQHNILNGQPIFVVDKVKERLEELTLEGKDLMMMMVERGEGFPVEKLSKLKVVTLMSLHHKGLHFLKRLHRLDTLVVDKGSVQVLFSHELGVGEEQLVHVKHLNLQSLHNLKHIWKWNQHSPLNLKHLLDSLQTLRVSYCRSLINIAPSSSSFQNLSSLDVFSCDGLKNLVTVSIVRTMVNLTQMTINGCKNMTEIVAKDGATEEEIVINFKKLKSLEFYELPTLTCFCSAINHVFNFPSLEQVIVHECSRMITFYDGSLTTPKLRGIVSTEWEGSLNATTRSLLKDWVVEECGFSSTAIPTDKLNSFKNLTKIEVKGCELVEQVFDLEGLSADDGLLQELTDLHLINLPMLNHLCNNNPYGMLDLKNLVLVKLENCGSLKYAFTWSMALCLLKLEELELKSCKMMEGLIETAAGSNNNIVLPELRKISIHGCPKMKMLDGKGFPNLEELSLDSKSIIILQPELATVVLVLDLHSFPNKFHVSSIPKLNNVKKVKIHDSSSPSLKELFKGLDYDESKLESLEVYECHRLISIAPSSESFQTLTILNVHNCNGLVNLVTSTVAKSMVHLVELEVQHCDNLTEIVAGEEDGAIDEIVFINLKKLNLYDLQSLAAFCLSNYTFKFPCLEQVRLGIFPNLCTFCLGLLTAPKLHGVELTDGFCTTEQYWEGDLNATIIQLHVKMVGFSYLRDLKLSKFIELKEKWNSQFPFSCLQNLRKLVVDECGLFSSAISSNVVQAVNELKVLVVEKCESLEKVFDLDSLNAYEGDIGMMRQLNELHLIHLPRLRNVWNKDHGGILSFENLTLLKVHDCGKLTNIFTLWVALDLANLQQLEVKRCTSVQHIITKGGEEIGAWNIFPYLHSISLECLPSLLNFYSEGDVVKFRSLAKIDVVLCPKIELVPSTFSNEDVMIFAGKVAIPSLEELNW